MAKATPFTAETNEFVVLRLRLDAYRATQRSLPEGYEVLPEPVDRAPHRMEEKRLLKRYFLAWRKPFYGRLAGFREDSPVFAVHRGSLVCGVYLVDDNELGDPGWGQLHYAFIDPAHRGKGLYSVVFCEAVCRARHWGLEGLVLNSDRHLLPEVYIRWGATPSYTLRKGRVRRALRVLTRILRQSV